VAFIHYTCPREETFLKFLGIIVLIVLFISPAMSNDRFIKTTSYKPLDKNMITDVQPWDNSARNIKVVDRMRQELTALG